MPSIYLFLTEKWEFLGSWTSVHILFFASLLLFNTKIRDKLVSLNKAVYMATRNYISVEEAVEMMCNDNLGNELIPELIQDSENDVIICGDVHISGTLLDNVSSNYLLTVELCCPVLMAVVYD